MDFLTDLNGIIQTSDITTKQASNSTNKKAGSDLQMDDFLQLMVAMFQNQSIDDNVSTSEMMNQMMQMSVIQAITNITTTVNQTTGLSYAASLVGKEVTVGEYISSTNVKQTSGTVTGTGVLNGQQVIFLDNDEAYLLSDVLAVGKIPEEAKTGKTNSSTDGKTSTEGKTGEIEIGSGSVLKEGGLGKNVGPLYNSEKTEQTNPFQPVETETEQVENVDPEDPGAFLEAPAVDPYQSTIPYQGLPQMTQVEPDRNTDDIEAQDEVGLEQVPQVTAEESGTEGGKKGQEDVPQAEAPVVASPNMPNALLEEMAEEAAISTYI